MDDIKHKIVETAFELFRQYGIRSVSIDDLCRSLGISKKTFYQYFPGKNELVEAVLLHLEHCGLELMSSYTDKKSAIEWVRHLQMIHSNIETVKDKPTFHYDLKKYYPQLYKKYVRNVYESIRHFLELHLRQGIKEGIYRKDLDVEMCAMMYSLIQYMFFQEEKEMENIDVKRLMNFAVSSFFRSILSSKGTELLQNEF